MWATLGKFVGGKVITAILVVASSVTLIWFWKHPEDLKALWENIKGVLVWLGFAAVLPWATFFVPTKVVKMESNAAGAAMLGGYLFVDMIVAFWLSGWSINGVLTWGVVLLGFLVAGIYNFLACDYLAEWANESA